MATESSGNYEVGYGKPPKHTQFQPGQSGNPRGRPRKTKDAEKLLNHELEQTIRIKEGGGSRALSMREAFIKSVLNAAVKGEKDARKMIFAYIMSQHDVEGFAPDAEDQKALNDLLKRINEQEG